MRGFDTDVQYNFISSVLLYIRRVIVQKRVEDLQLGVESYQRTINLTKLQLSFPRIKECSQYMLVQLPSFGITYLNHEKRLRYMRYDEIHKFCDVMLKTVRDGLVERLTDDKERLKRGNLQGGKQVLGR